MAGELLMGRTDGIGFHHNSLFLFVMFCIYYKVNADRPTLLSVLLDKMLDELLDETLDELLGEILD